jgi:hypothetical protein
MEGRLDEDPTLNNYYNMHYGTALVVAFIIKYRSSYDNIAKAFIEIRQDRGKPPKQRFTKLHDLCKKDYAECEKIMGKDLARLIQSCDWYKPILDARDGIIHDNLQSSGFMHPLPYSFRFTRALKS